MLRPRIFTLSLLAVFVVVLLITPPAGADSYTFTDLGTLLPRGINNSGQIVGTVNNRAVLWSNGSIQDLGTLPGHTWSNGYGINDAGQVVGQSVPPSMSPSQGVLWGNGSIQGIGTLNLAFPPYSSSAAVGINNVGQIVGTSDSRAVLWQNGTLTNLGVLPEHHGSGASRINGAGQIVGTSLRTVPRGVDTDPIHIPRATLWQNGLIQDLGMLPGSDRSHAWDINEAGHVVGNFDQTSGSRLRAFVWRAGMLQELGTLGGIHSRANGINNLDDIVGFSTPATGSGRAFLWTNGTMHDLNGLVTAEGWLMSEAWEINDAGQIIGQGRFGGETRGFLLTPLSAGGSGAPVPEPASLLLLASGVAGLGRWRHKDGLAHDTN